ncbi:MAG: hypothetical protein QM767_18145 [Anaeromyxobacter sp.]
MEVVRVGRSGLRWAFLASCGGLAVSVLLAVVTSLDNRLVAAYRAGRALPYRMTFFLLVFCFGLALWSGLLWRVPRNVFRAALTGALLGYLSGFLAWWIAQCLFISVGGAWADLIPADPSSRDSRAWGA